MERNQQGENYNNIFSITSVTYKGSKAKKISTDEEISVPFDSEKNSDKEEDINSEEYISSTNLDVETNTYINDLNMEKKNPIKINNELNKGKLIHSKNVMVEDALKKTKKIIFKKLNSKENKGIMCKINNNNNLKKTSPSSNINKDYSLISLNNSVFNHFLKNKKEFINLLESENRDKNQKTKKHTNSPSYESKQPKSVFNIYKNFLIENKQVNKNKRNSKLKNLIMIEKQILPSSKNQVINLSPHDNYKQFSIKITPTNKSIKNSPLSCKKGEFPIRTTFSKKIIDYSINHFKKISPKNIKINRKILHAVNSCFSKDNCMTTIHNQYSQKKIKQKFIGNDKTSKNKKIKKFASFLLNNNFSSKTTLNHKIKNTKFKFKSPNNTILNNTMKKNLKNENYEITDSENDLIQLYREFNVIDNNYKSYDRFKTIANKSEFMKNDYNSTTSIKNQKINDKLTGSNLNPITYKTPKENRNNRIIIAYNISSINTIYSNIHGFNNSNDNTFQNSKKSNSKKQNIKMLTEKKKMLKNMEDMDKNKVVSTNINNFKNFDRSKSRNSKKNGSEQIDKLENNDKKHYNKLMNLISFNNNVKQLNNSINHTTKKNITINQLNKIRNNNISKTILLINSPKKIKDHSGIFKFKNNSNPKKKDITKSAF